jgi:DNA polymerase-1
MKNSADGKTYYMKKRPGGWRYQMEKLMLIDGNSILNRAFYGLQGPQLLSAADGLHTNAIYGFLNILNKFLTEEEPQYICVAFDLRAPTFRHREYADYKAHRKGMPPELAEQVPYMKEILDAMNIKRLEMEGFEADDIIGSVSKCAEEAKMEVVIITGDRDSLQLASENTRVIIPVTRYGRTQTEYYDEKAVFERYGVTPAQLIDVKALMGDKSDNIPGIPGIGEKTALELIKAYGTLEGVYENIDRIDRKSVREKLEANKDLALLSRRLAAIERNMPTLCALDELKRQEFDRDRLYKLFSRLEFKSLIEKYGLQGENSTNTGGADHPEFTVVDDPIALAGLAASIAGEDRLSMCHLLDNTNRFVTRLSGIAFSWGEQNAYVKIGERISDEQFLEIFGDLFSDAGIIKYGHDLKNFIVYLKRNGVSFDGLGFDTMIGAYILDPSRSTYTLSELSQLYMGYSFQSVEELRGKGKNFTPYHQLATDQVAPVAVMHSRTIIELVDVIKAKISENGQEKLCYEIEMPLIEVLADMEYRGFKVNRKELEEYSARLDDRIKTAESDIHRLAGEQFNINSPKQLGKILFEKLGLPVIKRTKTGYSTDAEVLDQLADEHEIISRILEYRQLIKLKSTYAEGLLNMINPDTGRIHSSFNQAVTATGRISSTEPNLQNIPVKLEMGREIRKVFVPENDDFLLADADYSQIELRVLAHIAGDENMRAAFLNDEDIHTATAAGVFKVPKEEVTPLMRTRAKAVNFGIVYGIGDFSLSRDLGITRKQARKYIDDYLERYPGVRAYMKNIVDFGKQKGYVETIFGRRRYLPELKSSNFNVRSFGERVAMNMPIQGTAADIIKIAMVNVYKELRARKMISALILQVHDELIVETSADEKEEVEMILKQCMENAAKIDVPLIAEVKTGSSWYDTK